MKSKTLMTMAVTGALAAGAVYAATFEGRLICDQDPRYASSASCVLDRISSTESANEASEPMQLTYYGERIDDWMSLAMSEPSAVTDYYVLQEGSDPLAGFEWVLGPELVGYYLSDTTYYVTDATTGDVIVIHGLG